jgi:Fe-S-cluster containining protein
VTLGDVERIAGHLGRDDFFHFQVASEPLYLDQDDDPVWHEHVIREDNSRRVLKRLPDGDCSLLGPQGCTLPLEVRPLVCRLYPYDYNEHGIRDDLTPGCPLELLRPGQDLIETLGMKLDDARRWHKQLYEEILLEEVRQPESRDEASEYTGQEAATRVLVPDHEGPEY